MKNYKQLFSIQANIEETLKKACPSIEHKSGLYFLIRIDIDTGEKCIYIGKSRDVCTRMISHIQGYQQRIDISLKKRGLFSKDNLQGWKLNVMTFPNDMLDKMESYYIDKYKNAGYTLYNIESGGTTGKTLINERKANKGYHDGLQQGYINAQRYVANLFNKNLTFAINGKESVNKQKAYAKFEDFLKIEIKPKNEQGGE